MLPYKQVLNRCSIFSRNIIHCLVIGKISGDGSDISPVEREMARAAHDTEDVDESMRSSFRFKMVFRFCYCRNDGCIQHQDLFMQIHFSH